MKIPVAKPYLTKEEAKAAYETILTGWVTQGPRVEEFETKFAQYVGSKYAVAVSSCTAALHLSLIVAGIESGDEVICPSMSFIATANAIRYVQGRPVFAEVNPKTYNIDVKHIDSLITPKTKAILIVHQVGLPADIDAFRVLCRQHKLKLIEDAACAAGSIYKGKKIGSHSDLVCFSFHPRKVITTGDGGMITTSNRQYYERLKLLRQHGMSISDRVRHAARKVIFEDYTETGYNYRTTDIQAAVGIKQLEKLDWIVGERRKIARKYHDALADLDCLQLPSEMQDYVSNYQSYLLYLKKNAPISRDSLMQKMLDKNIATRRSIMTAHRTKAYQEYIKVSLPISEDVSDHSVIIPLYVPMTKAQVDYVVKAIRTLLQK